MSDKTLSYKGYCGSVEISIEDNCLFGKILFVNDLVSYEGDTPAALKAAFEEAVDYYLKKCSVENVAPDKPFSGTFNVRFSPELHRAAAFKAAGLEKTLNEFVRGCVENGIAEERIVTIHENHFHGIFSESTETLEYEQNSDEKWTQTVSVQKTAPAVKH